MRFNSAQLKRSLVFGLFVAIMVWLGLLTQKSSQHNQILTSLNQTLSSNESTINYQRVSEKLAELSEQIDLSQSKSSELVKQGQLSPIKKDAP